MRATQYMLIAAMVSLFAAAGCEKKADGSGEENTEKPAEGESSKSEGSESEGKVTPDGPAELQWRNDHDAALAAAKKAGKPAIIDFTAEWCAPCKQLEQETFSNPKVVEALSEYVAIKVDGTESAEAVEAEMNQHGVAAFPTVVFVGPDGKTLDSPRITEFVGPDKFLELVAQAGK